MCVCVCAVFKEILVVGISGIKGGQKGAFGDRDSGKEPTHWTASPLEASQLWLSAALGSEFQVSALLPACQLLAKAAFSGEDINMGSRFASYPFGPSGGFSFRIGCR